MSSATGSAVLEPLCAQAVVKLPFADVSRLAAAAQQDAPDERELTPVEEARLKFPYDSAEQDRIAFRWFPSTGCGQGARFACTHPVEQTLTSSLCYSV